MGGEVVHHHDVAGLGRQSADGGTGGQAGRRGEVPGPIGRLAGPQYGRRCHEIEASVRAAARGLHPLIGAISSRQTSQTRLHETLRRGARRRLLRTGQGHHQQKGENQETHDQAKATGAPAPRSLTSIRLSQSLRYETNSTGPLNLTTDMGRHSTRYPAEVRERAVGLVFEYQGEHGSQWAAMCSIAAKFGCTTETLRRWVRQAERDSGAKPGMTSDDRERVAASLRWTPARKRRDPLYRDGALPGTTGKPCGRRLPRGSSRALLAAATDVALAAGWWPLAAPVATAGPVSCAPAPTTGCVFDRSVAVAATIRHSYDRAVAFARIAEAQALTGRTKTARTNLFRALSSAMAIGGDHDIVRPLTKRLGDEMPHLRRAPGSRHSLIRRSGRIDCFEMLIGP